MNKLLALSVLSMMTTAGFASNFYIGGDVGFASKLTRLHHHFDEDVNDQHHLGAWGVTGGGFAGYNFDFCKFDFGVEVFINGTSTETKYRRNDGDQADFRLHANYNYGVRILPGFYLMDCVEAHLILGYTRANMSWRDRRFFNNDFNRHCRTFDVNGGQVGGGLRLDMGCNLSLRFDGIFSGYQSDRHEYHYTTSSLDHFHRFNPIVYTFDATAAIIWNF